MLKMSSTDEQQPKVTVYDRDGKQLREFIAKVNGTDGNLKILMEAVKCIQKETNDFLTELVCHEKSQNNKNDYDAQNVDDEDEDSEDDDSNNYSGTKFKKKRKM